MRKILLLLLLVSPLLLSCNSKDESPQVSAPTNGKYDCENILIKYNIPSNNIQIGSYEKSTLLHILYLEDNHFNVLLFDPRGKKIVKEEHLLCEFKDEVKDEKINLGYGEYMNYHPGHFVISRLYMQDDVFAMAISISSNNSELYPLRHNLYFFNKDGLITKYSKLNSTSYNNTHLEEINNGYILNHTPETPESNSKYQYTLYNKKGQLICVSERQEPIDNDIELFTDKEVVTFKLKEEKLSLYIYDTTDETKDKLFEFSKSDGTRKFKIKDESLTLDGRTLTFKCRFVSYEGKVTNFKQNINLDTKKLVE